MREFTENPWPRQHFKNDPHKAAQSLSRESRKFLRSHLRGENPAVPDNVWHGSDHWVLEHNGQAWRIGVFAKEVMKVLALNEKTGTENSLSANGEDA